MLKKGNRSPYLLVFSHSSLFLLSFFVCDALTNICFSVSLHRRLTLPQTPHTRQSVHRIMRWLEMRPLSKGRSEIHLMHGPSSKPPKGTSTATSPLCVISRDPTGVVASLAFCTGGSLTAVRCRGGCRGGCWVGCWGG